MPHSSFVHAVGVLEREWFQGCGIRAREKDLKFAWPVLLCFMGVGLA